VLLEGGDPEPRLRRSADLVLTASAPPPHVADCLLERIAEFDASAP
jgi:hypothetical protein